MTKLIMGRTMATQQEVKAFLRQTYNIASENGNLLGFGFKYDDGRKQGVIVEVREDLMRILSRVAKGGQISSDKVLESSDTVFGISKIEDDFYLTHVVFLENVDPNEITVPIHLVCVFADEFEKSLGLGDNS